jgi:hypothetical protein
MAQAAWRDEEWSLKEILIIAGGVDGWLRVQGHEASRIEVSAYLTFLYFLIFSFLLYDNVAGYPGQCLATNTDISTFDSIVLARLVHLLIRYTVDYCMQPSPTNIICEGCT